MSHKRRLQRVEEQASECWLRDEAARAGVSMEEAWRQSDLWDEQLCVYGLREGDVAPGETIAAFLHEFSLAVAPDEDPEPYVEYVLALWDGDGAAAGRSG